MTNHLVLIGYRGSGKTTVGMILAQLLDRPFVDTDELIESAAGCSIADIFLNEGEPGFRRRESVALVDAFESSESVISTGGGIVLNELNRERLRTGFVAWLTAPPEVLWQRMLDDPLTASRRPNLSSGGLEEVKAVSQQREQLYAATAHARFDVSADSPERIADAILREYERSPSGRG
jgi:shikimate kinase